MVVVGQWWVVDWFCLGERERERERDGKRRVVREKKYKIMKYIVTVVKAKIV